MQLSSNTKVEHEITRLSKLGWRKPESDTQKSATQAGQISYPQNIFKGRKENTESLGFWARLRAIHISRYLRNPRQDLIWEIGCGQGTAAIPLSKLGFQTIGVEPLQLGVQTMLQNDFLAFCGTFRDLKFPENSIRAFGMFDVLEHLETPSELLSDAHRALMPGGLLVISVPAYNWLYSNYDASIGHYRRYTRRSLKSDLLKSGFIEYKSRYIFSGLLLPAIVFRKVVPIFIRRKQNSPSLNSESTTHGWRSRLLDQVVFGILFVIDLIHLPFGLSIVAQAKKPL